METLWKVSSSLVVLFFLGLCNGLPINLENSGPDPHTQFLTGLVAVLLTVCSVVLLAGCLCCQRQNGFKDEKKQEFRDSPVASSATIISSNLDHGHINPIANSSSEFTIFTPISPPHHNNNVFLANQRIVSCNQEDYKDGDIDASLWFDGSEKDFPRTKLKYIRELGKGWFGRVVEGTAQNVSDDPADPEWTPVVVRILEASATSREKLLFLNDATVYKCGYHPNILRILGRSLDTVPLLLLQEYCPQGDLKKYLRMCKSSQDKLVAEDMPLQWCYQLTLAIKFLHDQKLTHPDLSARNCLLSESLSLKLGDYGLSATYYPEDYYQGSPGVPLRWCAPEIISYTSTTIQTTPTTTESNVWALGITMWEILEWGEQPYSGLTDDEVISQVLGTSKVRLSRPTYHLIYTDYMYKIMQSCWYNAESRVTVSQIDLMMADLMHVYKHTKVSLEMNSDIASDAEPISLQDFDSRWNALKPNSLLAEDGVLKQTQQSHQSQDHAQKSASLNNLHGSLDNLLDNRQFDLMESWLETVASDTSDLSFVRGLSEAITDLDNAIAMENMSSSPEFGKSKLIVGGQITTSESETEDENWKKKIERGAYTEKVRQKSRSVADLMVLTHIDCSESDSETLPSLDFKVNQRVRYLKNVDNQKKFGSEGNLLHVHDNTFQEELKKLQEERRDSLLFVPDKFSECSFSGEGVVATTSGITPTSITNNRLDSLENSPVKKLMEKLNSPSEMVPPQRVYNVFNVCVQHMNVGGTVCDKMSENIGQIYLDGSAGDILEKETISENICDRRPESNVLENNAIISQDNASENQINPFSVYISDQNLENIESTNHIKTSFNYPVSEPFLNVSTSNSLYSKYVNDAHDENTTLSRNYEANPIINKTSETYLWKKDDNNDFCKIKGAREEFKVNYQKMLPENHFNDPKLRKNETINERVDPQIILNENNKTGVTGVKHFSSNESLTRSDSPKENNFDIKIEILNEQNSTLSENMQKSYDINIPKKIGNDFASKENFVTSNENSKNVKLKVPKLSEMIQRNAVDFKVHHHHSASKDKVSVISKNEENDKSIHQEVIDKDSGLNTPENSASLEKLYDDNEEILDVGSFDSDRSNEASNKGNLLNDISNEDHIAKVQRDEASVISYIESQKEFDREEEISNIIDLCANKETRLKCDLFLANEKTNYSEGFTNLKSDQKLRINDNAEDKGNEEVQFGLCDDTEMFSNNIKSTNVIKENQFVNSDYKTDIQTFILSEVYHSSCLISKLNENKQKIDIEELLSDKNICTMKDITVGHAKLSLDYDASFKTTCPDTLSYTFNANANDNEVPDVDLKNELKCVEKDQKANVIDKFFVNKIETNITLTDKNMEQENSKICDNTRDSLLVTDAKLRNMNSETFEKTDLFEEDESTLMISNYYNDSHSHVNDFSKNANEFIQNGNTSGDNWSHFTYPKAEFDRTQINQSTLIIAENHISNNKLSNNIAEEANMRKDIENNITSIIQDAIKIIENINLTTLKEEFQNESVEYVNLPREVLQGENKSSENEILESFVTSEVTHIKNDVFSKKESNSQAEHVNNFEIDGIVSQNCDIVPKEQSDINLNKNVSTYNTVKGLLNNDKTSDHPDILSKTKEFLHNEIENYVNQSNKNDDIHMVQKEISVITNFNENVSEKDCDKISENLRDTLPATEGITNQHDETERVLDFAQNIDGSIENLKHVPLEITKVSLCNVSNQEIFIKTDHENETSGSFPVIEEAINKDRIKIEDNMLAQNNTKICLINETEENIHAAQNIINHSNNLKQFESSDVSTVLSYNNQLPIIMEEKTADALKYTPDINCDTLIKDNQNLKEVKDKQHNTNDSDLLNSTHDKYLNTNVDDAVIKETSTFLRNEISNYVHSVPATGQRIRSKINIMNSIRAPENESQLINGRLGLTERDNLRVKCYDSEKDNEITNNENRNEEQFCDLLNQNLTEINKTPKEYLLKDDILSAKCITQTANFLCHEIKNYVNFEPKILFTEKDSNTKLDVDQELIFCNSAPASNCTQIPPEELSCISNDNDNKEDIQNTHDELENQTNEVNLNDTSNSVRESVTGNNKSTETERTSTFLKNEIENYIGTERRVDFDLSDTQDKMSLNSLTHLSAFTSTPFANRRPNESTVILGANDDYSIDYYSGLKTSVDPEDNSNLQFSSNFVRQNNNNDLYSLETWDNFLGRSFDEQENAAMDFSDFSQEPHSLLFLECDADNGGEANDLKMTKILNETYNAGMVPTTDETFTKNQEPESANLTFDVNMDKTDVKIEIDPWKNKTSSTTNSGGWYLHPQCASKEPTEQLETNPDTAVASTSDESYVGFSMDDEIMAAIRNELLTKLPHAQRASSEHQIEENCEEMDSAERNEVFLRYNVYNTPLSPIPEESCDSEFGSGQITPKRINDTSDDEGDSSDWSVQEDNNSSNTHTEEIISPRVPESPARCRTDHCRHTPSQDSCCSNDTLFNIEDLNGGLNDKVLVDMALNLSTPVENILDSMEDETSDSRYDDCNAEEACITENEKTIPNDIYHEKREKHTEVPIIKTDHNYILEFLDNERYYEMNLNFDTGEEISSASDIYLTVSDNTFSFGQNIAPLNSPEDRPWKELQASFRNCDEDQLPKISSSTEEDVEIYANDGIHMVDSSVSDQENLADVIYEDKEAQDTKTSSQTSFIHHLGEGEDTDDCFISDEDIDKVLREELESEIFQQERDTISIEVANTNNRENSNVISCNDERIYVSLTKTESGESFNTEDSSCVSPVDNDDTMVVEYENLKINTSNEETNESKVEEIEDREDKFSRLEDLFGPLTDIRFSGPGNSSQLMTTSFSESNDLGDDQDWDSGSDTRSSSSGEFIWKEGEHEASVKALRAPPQLENVDYVTPMENIQEEEVFADSSKDNSCASSSSSGSEGEDECPEFVPSAWDKYATPTKSALRSPEKTLERSKEEKVQHQHTQKEKKSKGVSFKKQKYHCVYEYPREPESPVLQSYDLWKPTPDYATLSDWDLDTNTYLPTTLSEPECSFETQSRHDSSPKNLYHLSTFSDVNIDPTSLDEDFFVSSSSKPFDMLTGLTSQFFPGRQFSGETWIDNINITPDSGVEDITPANFTNNTDNSYGNKNDTYSQITEVQSLKALAANAAERNGRRRELGGLRHTRNKLKLDLPPSPSAFTSNRTFSVESVPDEIVSRQVPTFTTFGKSRFLVQHVDTPPDSGRDDKNVSFEALPHKKPEPYFVEPNDWKHQKKDKQKIESVRGEASLLDSTDEDSGIESCTLDRKRFNV